MLRRKAARALSWPVQGVVDAVGWLARFTWMMFIVANPILLLIYLVNREKRASSLDAARESGDDADVQDYVHWLKHRRERT